MAKKPGKTRGLGNKAWFDTQLDAGLVNNLRQHIDLNLVDGLIKKRELSDHGIANTVGTYQTYISARRRQLGLPPLFHGPARVSKMSKIASRVWELKKTGLTPNEISAALEKEGIKISKSTVYKIVRVSKRIPKERQLEAAIKKFQTLSRERRVETLERLGDAISGLERVIEPMDEAIRAKPELKNAIKPKDAEALERLRAKMKQLEDLRSRFSQYAPEK